MRIPPYWSKQQFSGASHRGRPQTFAAWGWSFTSLAEAESDALARARRIFDLVTRGERPADYEYHDRPIREERLKEIGEGGEPIAVVTRNRYGALVLNTRRVLFADVDFPRPPRPSLLGLFKRGKDGAQREAIIADTIRGVEAWAARNPRRAFRLYRTHAGLRLLFTDKLYVPNSDEATAMLTELGSDRMYIRMTQKQECFRARLTAKPWRCGCRRPPAGFPWPNQQAEADFRAWEREYTRIDAGYRTCEFLRQFGTASGNPEIATVQTAHDRGTRIDSAAPLA